MTKIISFVHLSLDGFVCGPNGEMDWITIEQEVFDRVEERIQLTNTAIYGRNTFQMMEGYWPTAADKPNASAHDKAHSKWYKDATKVVLSRTLTGGSGNTLIINDSIEDQLQALKNSSEVKGNIYIFGSPSATHSLISKGLVDGYWLFVNPILLGSGVPLFKDITSRTKLQLQESYALKCGVVEQLYFV